MLYILPLFGQIFLRELRVGAKVTTVVGKSLVGNLNDWYSSEYRPHCYSSEYCAYIASVASTTYIATVASTAYILTVANTAHIVTEASTAPPLLQ